jgi:hypothetical protein
VFGGAGGWPGLGTWHLHGRTWTKLKGISIDTASAVSPADTWAIADGPDHPWQSLEHYNGTRWSAVTRRGLGSNFQLTGIVAVSAKAIWLSGYVPGRSQVTGELARWDGHGWRLVPVTIAHVVTLIDPTADGHGGFWLDAYTATSGWAVHIAECRQTEPGRLRPAD